MLINLDSPIFGVNIFKMLETTTQLVGNHHPFEKHLRQNGFESSESCGVKTQKKTVETNWILSGKQVEKKNTHRSSQAGSLLLINGAIITPVYIWTLYMGNCN